MGGEGSGNWYRFDKKTTIGECHSVDVRYLHREGLLKPGNWFSLRWSRAEQETGFIRGAVIGDEKPERVILTYRHRSGSGGEWGDVCEPVHLSWTSCNFGGRGRGSYVREVDVAGRWHFCTDQAVTSCADAATTLPTRVSGITRCTGLSIRRRRSGSALEGART